MEKKKIIIISGVSLALIVLLSIIIIKMNTSNKTKANNTNTQNNQQEIQEQNQNEEPAKEEKQEKSDVLQTNEYGCTNMYVAWPTHPLMTKEYNKNGMPEYDSNGPITEEKLKEIIDNQLSFLFYKNSVDEITNEDLFYRAHSYLSINGKATEFSTNDLEDALSKTVLGNMQLIHESHFNPYGYDYIYDNGNYTRDEESYKHVDAYDEHPVFGKVISFNELNGEYTISVKYLWVSGHYASITEIYRNRQDAIDHNNKIIVPENEKCLAGWADKNFDIYKDELDTYNFVFKEENNHINLVDFYIN